MEEGSARSRSSPTPPKRELGAIPLSITKTHTRRGDEQSFSVGTLGRVMLGVRREPDTVGRTPVGEGGQRRLITPDPHAGIPARARH